MDKKIYEIGGRKYRLPKLTMEQYELISDDDGMHPSGSAPFPAGFGTTKCANLMFDFFNNEVWFLK